MTTQRRRGRIVAVAALIGALAGAGAGAALTGDSARYESTATVAIVPASDLAEDLAADFWQVLSEEQVVRTAATIYGNGQWAADAARALGVPGSEVELSATALVDTTLVEVSVQSGSTGTADAALAMILGSAGTSATEILQPFVISQASVQPAATARPGATMQLLGASAVAGALVGAGAGLVLAGIRRRDRDGVDPAPGSPGPRGPEPVNPGLEVADVEYAHPEGTYPGDPIAGRHAAGTAPASG
ncbi:hypothetical protein [Rhodococcus sp. IEGM 1408]|uniref:hypothetical protein n=1 Tax=Rhodococcus sp. IEGM 1408 TaxID=3082220 RepID=UPI002953EF36|nr:hypothetical protein [Rhodococcus sp. IEGM 1408]MDV7999969.1 hypothetical protein [Rhodococcus sp. IEGM 1408]